MKKMKMLFVYPDIGAGGMNFSPAIEILSAVLKQNGVKTDLFHIHARSQEEVDFDKIYEKIMEFCPNLIGFSATTYQYKICNDIAGYMKYRGVIVPIILGGIHATIAPQDLYKSNFDGFAIGEGEKTLVDLMYKIQIGQDYRRTRGFYFKKSGQIIKNSQGEVIEDLEELPHRDYEIFNVKQILKEKHQWFSIAFSRGCPYTCNFCINEKLRDVYKGDRLLPYYRLCSVERAIDELKQVVRKYGDDITLINLDDDLLLLDKLWFLDFAERFYKEIYQPYGIKYAINGRANLVNEEIAKALSRSGCDLIRMGFETGDEKLRNLVLNKSLSDSQLKHAFSLCRTYQIRSCAFTMIGIPHESEKSLKKTMELLCELKPSLIRLAIYEPFIGTSLYDYCIEQGFLTEEHMVSPNCFHLSSLKFDEIDYEVLILYHLMFPWYLNCLYLPEKYRAIYEKVIDDFYDGKEAVRHHHLHQSRILEKDVLISRLLEEQKIPHFRFLENNTSYVELYEPKEVN